MARARWLVARLVARRPETDSAVTLVLEAPDWPGHHPGQHVDVRLTAPDGYRAERAYSLAGPADGDRIELTVQRLEDGEVSPYLAEVFAVGDLVEIRGPVGGWFVWRPADDPPVLLVAGGSGIVPLMAMVRARRDADSRAPFRLIYSVRTPADVLYAAELRRRAEDDAGLEIGYVFTRAVPHRWPAEPHRIGPADLDTLGWPTDREPACYVCGPTGFVEAVADLLVARGHPADRVRTERFGPTG